MATQATPLAKVLLIKADAARLIGTSARWLDKLCADGFVKRSGAFYRPEEVAGGYIKFLQGEKRSSAKSTTQQSVQKARAREIELRTARAENEVVDTEEAIAVLDEIIGSLKSTFDGLAASATRSQDLQHIVQEKIDGALQQATDTLAKRAASLRKNGTTTGNQDDDEDVT